MFSAVEGGRFFSSSASGYSKGLTLLLGQRKKDKPMKVSPSNHYQLLDQEPDNDSQSSKNQCFRRCASFVCFSCTAAGLIASAPFNRGSAQKKTKQQTSVVHELVDHPTSVKINNNMNKEALRSSLRKPSKRDSASSENINGSPSQTKRRKVQWTDACGSELVEIREFEPSGVDYSDDELDNGRGRNCSCVMM